MRAFILFFTAVFCIVAIFLFYRSNKKNQNEVFQSYAQNAALLVNNYNKTQAGLLNEIALREDICIPNVAAQTESLKNAVMRINYSTMIIAETMNGYIYYGDDIAPLLFKNHSVDTIIKNSKDKYVDIININSEFFLVYAVPVFFSDENDGVLIGIKSLFELKSILDGLNTTNSASFYILNSSNDAIFDVDGFGDGDRSKNILRSSYKIDGSSLTVFFSAKNKLNDIVLDYIKQILIFSFVFFAVCNIVLLIYKKSFYNKSNYKQNNLPPSFDVPTENISNIVNVIKDESLALEEICLQLENNLDNQLKELLLIAARIDSTKEQAEREHNSAEYASDFINFVFTNALDLNVNFENQAANIENLSVLAQHLYTLIVDSGCDLNSNREDIEKLNKDLLAAITEIKTVYNDIKNGLNEFSNSADYIRSETAYLRFLTFDMTGVIDDILSKSTDINLSVSNIHKLTVAARKKTDVLNSLISHLTIGEGKEIEDD